jgi:hypothetical protein
MKGKNNPLQTQVNEHKRKELKQATKEIPRILSTINDGKQYCNYCETPKNSDKMQSGKWQAKCVY